MEVAPPQKSQPKPTLGSGSAGGNDAGSAVGIIIASIVGSIVVFIFHYGAARLSYNAYGSYGWSFLAFIFGLFYYPYYAFFVSKPASFFGGKRR